MRFKQGVKVNGIKPEMTIAMVVCDGIYKSFGQELVITSVTDSVHSVGSLHYVGYSFDARIRDFLSSDLEHIHKSIKANLTDEFDVVLEATHFHIEFQPKVLR